MPQVRTPADREAFDKLVQEQLDRSPVGRTEVARRLGLESRTQPNAPHFVRAVSASLKRGLRDGWAVAEGKGAWTRYRRTT